MSLTPRVLLEINISGEASKNGLTVTELKAQWETFQAVPNVTIAGLMTMAPSAHDPEAARPVFRALRQLREELVDRAAAPVKLTELSMGMSGDFSIAIEESGDNRPHRQPPVRRLVDGRLRPS